jgi:exonuclease III
MPFVRSAFIERHVRGSDHAPVGVEVDPRISAG